MKKPFVVVVVMVATLLVTAFVAVVHVVDQAQVPALKEEPSTLTLKAP